eukprot:CAMPEP_0198146084 /NCGR_PEP_ID=MMETSP1443-20131203/27283_1 /TAXON_ID=186043 /ORGANISM="Entomoneis sp., Strain CCMP2396" /LENGTH=183 /DNA_ID=CAMNT_0043809919 /DNA_START=38 /DNA_END=589 /DNA_ORIENTATION=-
MSTTATTTRRIVRTLSHRAQVDWTKPVFTAGQQATAHYNAIKSWVAMSDAEAKKYASPPGAVDFASAKSTVRDKALVEVLEAFYKANQPPAETFELSAEEQEKMEHHLAFLRDQAAFNDESLPVLKKELEFWKDIRTTTETTYDEMCMAHPVIHEEIEDEIERREWFKDTEFDKPQVDGHGGH